MIRLENICAGYNGVEVIKDIDIQVEEGCITCIIGKNGCGKTTLLKTAANLLKPYRGKVTIGDKDISEFKGKELARKISFLPQIRTVPDISVSGLVMHGRFPYLGFSRTPQKQDKEIVMRSIELMGLTQYTDRNVSELSGGMRQKAYIAMVLAQDTDIIFLDEPATYLDINHQLETLEIIKSLKEMGKTIVMVLHDLGSALSYSDKICLMDEGKAVIHEKAEIVYESKEIDKVFRIRSAKVFAEGKEQYVFLKN